MRSHVSSAWRENWSLSGDNAIFTISWKKTHFATLDTWILQITIIYTSVRCFMCFLLPHSGTYLLSSFFHFLYTLNLYFFLSILYRKQYSAQEVDDEKKKAGEGKRRKRAYKKAVSARMYSARTRPVFTMCDSILCTYVSWWIFNFHKIDPRSTFIFQYYLCSKFHISNRVHF